MKLSDYVDFNPRVALNRGELVPFVSMDVVEAGTRNVYPEEERPAIGSGSKFSPGDALFARITPCLQNGKIAQYAGNKSGMGSTEFFVLRAKPGISNSDFVYYFSQNPELRSAAEKSMTGASGRQRASLSSLAEFQCEFPSLKYQEKIAEILGAYDFLVENHQRRIQILESIMQGLYREWFVYFRFPNYEKQSFNSSSMGSIPKGWSASYLGQHLVALESGKRPKGGIKGIDNGVPSVGAENINGIGKHNFQSEKYVSREFFESMQRGVVKDGDVAIYKDGAYIGKSSYFRDSFPHAEFCINEHVFLLRADGKQITQNALYLWLQEPNTIHSIRATNTNAAQPGVNQQGINGLQIIVPDSKIALEFDDLIEPFFKEITNLSKQIKNLRFTRDQLLPRLIAGKINMLES